MPALDSVIDLSIHKMVIMVNSKSQLHKVCKGSRKGRQFKPVSFTIARSTPYAYKLT